MRSSSSKSAPTTFSAYLPESYSRRLTSDYCVALRGCTFLHNVAGRALTLLNVGDGYESFPAVGYGHRLDAMSVKAARR
jgi:hypothetical protein